jgi:excisionase family DNA binding protein
MQIKETLSQEIIEDVCFLLRRYIPELTPTSLVNALKEYGNNTEATKEQAIDKPLTRIETAKLLSMSLPTLDKLIKNGLIHANVIGRRVLINPEEIKRLLKREE